MSSEKNSPRVVLDTNVYISALIFGGLPAEIIELVREKSILLIVSPAILLELARILQTKFDFSRKMVLDIIVEIKRLAIIVTPKNNISVIESDPTDNKILECAVEGKADYIVTGDKKHLRPLNQYHGIQIKFPAEFIKRVA